MLCCYRTGLGLILDQLFGSFVNFALRLPVVYPLSSNAPIFGKKGSRGDVQWLPRTFEGLLGLTGCD